MKRFAGLAAVSASQIVITFVAQWVVIRVIGAGLETDALFAAATVPQLLVSVLVVSISQVLMTQLALRTPEESARMVSSLTLVTGGVFTVAAIILSSLSGIWLAMIFPVLFQETGRLLVVLAAISFSGMVFQSMEITVWSFHHSRGEHLFADGTGLVSAVLSLMILVPATMKWGVTGAAVAMSIRPLIHLVSMSRGLTFSFPGAADGEWLRKLGREVWPPVAGALYYKFDVLVDRVLSGLSGAGALSVYYLGQQMSAAFGQVMSNSLSNPALPIISRGVAAGDAGAVRGEIRRRVMWILAASALIYALFATVGRPVLELLFGGGALSTDDITLLYWIFVCLAGVVVGGAIGQITAGSFYALGQSRTPTVIGIATYTIYVPLKILAFRAGGLTALALSVTAFYGVNVLVQGWVLSRRIRRIDQTYVEAE